MEPDKGVDRQSVAALHARLLDDLAQPGDWWDGPSRRALIEEARAARGCPLCRDDAPHDGARGLSSSAVDVVHGVANRSARLDRSWAEERVAEIGDGRYAEAVGVTAIVIAIDVTARSLGEPTPSFAEPVDGPPADERPAGVGDVGAWIPMTEEKLLANVTRALSLVPRTNATWRTLVTECYSRGPKMLDLVWERALSRPQIELVAAQVSRLQECFY